MINDIINNFPSSVILLGGAFFFMGVAALIYWTLRHFFPNFTERGNLQAHAILVGILASTYGIMLGFIIVILWQAFVQLQATVALEASEVALIIADSYAFPAEIRNKIMGGAADYVKSVRFYEWETMREKAQASPKTVDALHDLLGIMLSFEPTTHNQRVFYEEIVKHFNNIVAYRRQRISAATSALPASLRAIIVLSAVLIIIFMCVLQSQRKKPDILKILLVTGVMASYVGLVFVLDYPFSGDIAVSDEAFTQGILADFKL